MCSGFQREITRYTGKFSDYKSGKDPDVTYKRPLSSINQEKEYTHIFKILKINSGETLKLENFDVLQNFNIKK